MKEPQSEKIEEPEQGCKGPQQEAEDGGRCVRPEASGGGVKSPLPPPETQEGSETHECDAATEILPQEMFSAVVAEMKASMQVAPKVAWTTTIAELYARVHDTVRVEEALIPGGKQRYPKLKGEEKAELYKLFRELCVVTEGTYKEWEEYAVAITQKLYNTSWSFKNIVLRMVSKVKWVKTQPLNQWATKIKSGTLPAGKRTTQV
ncbi:hypothetical protein PR001_g20673 [Phytophthora rubi]|uniref:Uncharacterized protein n=1 Tax=Phytophthora rubi TaxID=129364 RepID=A0A6A3JLV7_9STRA|nr:hypothetical protein PR001_g20673 [Phytophthora rubi]